MSKSGTGRHQCRSPALSPPLHIRYRHNRTNYDTHRELAHHYGVKGGIYPAHCPPRQSERVLSERMIDWLYVDCLDSGLGYLVLRRRRLMGCPLQSSKEPNESTPRTSRVQRYQPNLIRGESQVTTGHNYASIRRAERKQRWCSNILGWYPYSSGEGARRGYRRRTAHWEKFARVKIWPAMSIEVCHCG